MEFEVGQKWQVPGGTVREILAVGPEAVAYRSVGGVVMCATTPDEFQRRQLNGYWKLIHPKPIPEGWKEETPGALSFLNGDRAATSVFRQRYAGDGTKVGVTVTGGGTWMDPDSLKAAIDYVMSDPDE